MGRYFRGCVFFLSEAPEKVPRDFFFLLSLFFFIIFCCFVCLICVCEGYTWKVSSSCHQKLEPMFGEEGRAIHAVHGMTPRLQQHHFNNSNSFYNLKVCVPSYAYKRGTSVHLGLM